MSQIDSMKTHDCAQRECTPYVDVSPLVQPKLFVDGSDKWIAYIHIPDR